MFVCFFLLCSCRNLFRQWWPCALRNGRLSNYELCLFQFTSLNQLVVPLIMSASALPTSTLQWLPSGNAWRLFLDTQVRWPLKRWSQTRACAWMFELLCDNYCAPFDISRVTLLCTPVWLKHYPYDALPPCYQWLHLPRIGIFVVKRHRSHYLVPLKHRVRIMEVFAILRWHFAALGAYPATEGGGGGLGPCRATVPPHRVCRVTRGRRCVVLCCVVLCYATEP